MKIITIGLVVLNIHLALKFIVKNIIQISKDHMEAEEKIDQHGVVVYICNIDFHRAILRLLLKWIYIIYFIK